MDAKNRKELERLLSEPVIEYDFVCRNCKSLSTFQWLWDEMDHVKDFSSRKPYVCYSCSAVANNAWFDDLFWEAENGGGWENRC